MNRNKWAIVLAVLVVLAAVADAHAAGKAKREGTDWKELAARKPSSPSGMSVAILPFGLPVSSIVVMPRTQVERQVELPRACVLLNLQRHGFRIVPEAASLSLVPTATDKVIDLKPDDKLTAEWGREGAVEAGRKLGADWVVYGDFILRMDYQVKLFRTKPIKIVRLNLHFVLADVATGEVIYWSRIEEGVRGSSASHGIGDNVEDAEIARSALVRMTNSIFDDIAEALPKHKVGPEVTREQLEKLIGAMGL